MRILIVEDEERIADFLRRGLTADGHTCVVAKTGEESLKLAQEGDFDIILLDLILPGMHGLDVCQQLRMKKVNTPLIILTAMDSLEDIVNGLHLGADDYMTKPFAFDELVARIETVMRRSSASRESPESKKLVAGPVVFDRDALLVTVKGEPVKMTAKEMAVLELLMSHPSKLFSRERILANIWGMNIDPMTNVVDVYIARLRKLIDTNEGESMIETVHGIGYRFNAPPGHYRES